MWTCRNAALALLLTLLSTSVFAQGAFLAGTPTPQATSLTAIPASARIVFHTNQVIYTMDAAGGNITQITYVPGRALDHIAVSPDRKRVVASYVLDGLEKLVLFDLDAGTEVLLVPYFYRAGYGGVDWDLAGNIYFVGIEDLPYPTPTTTAENQANAAAFDVYRVKYDGTQVQRITSTTDHGEADVSVSADGTLITYVSSITTGGTTSEVWTNTIAGTAPHLVYNEPLPATRNVHDPELSPDNTKVVFSRVNPAFHNFPSGPNTAHDLYKINVNGTGLTLITTPGPISILPDWKDTSIVYLELSDEAVDYLGVSTISDTGTGKVRINGNAASPKWIETATVPTVPPPIAAAPPPANLRVQKLSWSVYPNPANDAAIVTAAAYLGNTTGEATAMAKMLALGGDVAPRYLKWRDVEANLGVYDFTKIDALVATSGELPLVVNVAPIWDDGSTSIPTGLAFTTFGDPAVVLAYQNMLTAAVAHLKGRLYALIVGSEVDTYLTTDSRRAQYAAFLQQVRGFARTKFGTNPFLVTTSLRSTVTSTWADWAGIASVVDLNAFTYYPDSTPETFGPRIVADLQHFAALGPFMLPEVGISVTGIGEDVQSAEMQALTGIIGVIADTSHRIPIVIFAGLSDVSAAVLADFGYSSGQLTAGMGLRTTANAGKVGYVTLCGSFGGTNCADLVAPAPTCTFTLAASSDTFSAALGSDTVALTASDVGCAWTRQILDGAPTWLSVTAASGVGSATITYSVTANTGSASRSARFTIGDGDIFTITQAGATPPNPDPDPDPFLPCTSTTASPTGVTPTFHYTNCRQDTWNREYADYLINPANPPTMGGKWFQWLKTRADCSTVIAAAGCAYWDIGQYDVMTCQIIGDPTYCRRGYAKLMERLGPVFPCYPNCSLITGLGTPAQTDKNVPRTEGAVWVWMYDWVRPFITANQDAALLEKILAQLEYANTLPPPDITNRRLDDSDQTMFYFPVKMLHLLVPNNARATALDADAIQGGLAAVTASNAFFQFATGATRRDAIRSYIESHAEGGAWFESCKEYDLGTTFLLTDGVDAIRTATGVDYFPEYTTWLPTWGARLLSTMTPDLNDTIQCGDEEQPHVWLGRQFTWSINLGMTQGVLRGTSLARRLQGQFNDLVSRYGYLGSTSMEPRAQAQSASFVLYYNPYETADANWTQQAYTGRGAGLFTYRSNTTSTTASFLVSVFGRVPKVTAGSDLGKTNVVDHAMFGSHGDLQFYRNGEWVLDHPFCYTGYGCVGGDDTNSPLMHGWGGMMEYRADNFATSSDANHGYAVGTTGGVFPSLPYFEPPRVATHEWTRAHLFVPGTTDTILVYDRANVTDILDRSRYPVANTTTYQSQELIDAAPSAKILVWHMPVSPTIAGNETSWTTTGGQAVKLTTLLPATTTKVIENETTRTRCLSIAGCGNWNSVSVFHAAQKKFQVKIYPTSEHQWDTFLSVFQFGAPGVVTLKQANGCEGAHVTRPGQADVFGVFNGTQGTTLALASYDPSHKAALDVVRYRGVGCGPLAWSAVGSSTLVYLEDLDPLATWTLNIDAAGANAIVPNSAGEYSFTVSGAGSHTITTVGSGSVPPPDPVGCPTITLSPTTLPSGTTGSAYAQVISASGGTPAYTFVVSVGSLPTGLSLATNGNLTGTPTVAGDYTFTVKASQANACLGTQAYTLTIAGAATTDLARAGTAQTIVDFTGSVSSITGTVTGPAGTNRLAVINAIGGGGTDLFTSCLLGGGATTLIKKVQATGDLWLYTLRQVAPPIGSTTLTCSWSGVQGTTLAAVIHFYVNVDQTTPIDVSASFVSPATPVSPTIQASVTTTKTNTWTVLAARSWGVAEAGLASNPVGSCCGLGVFDFGPRALPGLKQMEATYPSPVLFGAVMFAINPAP